MSSKKAPRPTPPRRRPGKALPPNPEATTISGGRWVYKPELLEIYVPGKNYVTIWRWMRDGKFPLPYTIGDKNAWKRTELEPTSVTLLME